MGALRRKPVGLITAVSLLAVLAGCGGTEPRTEAERFAARSPDAMMKAGIAAMRDLGSFRLRFTDADDGDEIRTDAFVSDRRRCRIDVDTGDGARATVIITATATYQKGNTAYWSQGTGPADADFVAAVNGRWAKSPPIEQLARLCDLDRLLAEIREVIKDADDFSVRTALENGQRVVKLADPGEHNFVYFSHAAPHRILAISGGDGSRFDFSEFDVPVVVEEPTRFVDITDVVAATDPA